MVALVLAQAVLEKFGGDSIGETRRNVRSYLDRLRERDLAAGPSAAAEPSAADIAGPGF